jgi:glycosyltransferase involved in cell wall biosynthesis
VKILLGRSRVCVVPSLWENYPNVILEAMAAGVAVAASNRGGIPELITNSTNGYLFNPLMPSEIVRAINKLLSSDEERFQITAAARYWLRSSQLEVEQRSLELYGSMLKKSTYAPACSQ